MDNFEIQRYIKEARFHAIYSRNSTTEIKGALYVINLDEFKSTGKHWIASYVNSNNATYFDSFEVEYIPKEIEKFIGNKNITNLYRI